MVRVIRRLFFLLARQQIHTYVLVPVMVAVGGTGTWYQVLPDTGWFKHVTPNLFGIQSMFTPFFEDRPRNLAHTRV